MKTTAGQDVDKGFPGKSNSLADLLVIVGVAFVGIGLLVAFIVAEDPGIAAAIAIGCGIAATGFVILGLGAVVEELRAMRRDSWLTSNQLREQLSGQVVKDSPADSRQRP